MEAILTEKLNVISLERYNDRETTQWKIDAKCKKDCNYMIHGEYHDKMLHVHLEKTTNPKVINRIEMLGGTTTLFIKYLFDKSNTWDMDNDEFIDHLAHLFIF